MPAFIFISGLLTSQRAAVHSVLEILIIYVICQILLFIYSCLSYLAGFNQMPDFFLLCMAYPGWGLWYLLALCAWRLCAIPLSTIKTTWQIPLLLVLVLYGTGAGMITGLGGTLSLSRIICFAPFFAAGYFSKLSSRNIFIGGYKSSDWLMILGCALLTPLSMYLAFSFNDTLFSMHRPFALLQVSPVSGLLFRTVYYLSAFCAIRVLFLLGPNAKSWLTTLGKLSLSLYVGHFYIAKISTKFMNESNCLWLIPLSVLVCIVLLPLIPLQQYLRKTSSWILNKIYIPPHPNNPAHD
jgi:fucose 4-O-acetylase-like acetyltransferase